MEPSPAPESSRKPLVFISHDRRDEELAKAFATLLAEAGAGMIESFVAGRDIPKGEGWYEAIIAKLNEMQALVCLLTPRSHERPWVLFEVGVGKGREKEKVHVHGVDLGFTVGEPPPGPFAQIQICKNNKEDMVTFMKMLIIPLLPLWNLPLHLLEDHIHKFRNRVEDIEKSQALPKHGESATGLTASLAEELKAMLRAMPLHIESKLSENLQNHGRGLRFFSMDALESAVRAMKAELRDPIGLLVLCNAMREELPWLYDLGLDTYREVRTGRPERATAALSRMSTIVEILLKGSSLAELGMTSVQMSEALEMLQAHLKELERATSPASAR